MSQILLFRDLPPFVYRTPYICMLHDAKISLFFPSNLEKRWLCFLKSAFLHRILLFAICKGYLRFAKAFCDLQRLFAICKGFLSFAKAFCHSQKSFVIRKSVLSFAKAFCYSQKSFVIRKTQEIGVKKMLHSMNRINNLGRKENFYVTNVYKVRFIFIHI